MLNIFRSFNLDYPWQAIGNSLIIHADCFEWFARIPENSIHAIVTDPPYGVKEYDFDQLQKRATGNGGIWRIPPSFDGNVRSPLPRFTALNHKERKSLHRYFFEWAKVALRALRPGAHLFIASNSFLSQLVFSALVEGGLEYRGSVVRLVRTLRGGDRPKNAEDEYSEVCSLPRGCYEPWGLFRKPIPNGMTVSDCLKKYQTGGLRRKADGNPFEDVIESERTLQKERRIADHIQVSNLSLYCDRLFMQCCRLMKVLLLIRLWVRVQQSLQRRLSVIRVSVSSAMKNITKWRKVLYQNLPG